MKTSLILLAALILNTTLLLAEPLSALVKNVHPWMLILLEGFLLLGYFLNRWTRDLSKSMDFNLGNLNLLVFKGNGKRASLFHGMEEKEDSNTKHSDTELG